MASKARFALKLGPKRPPGGKQVEYNPLRMENWMISMGLGARKAPQIDKASSKSIGMHQIYQNKNIAFRYVDQSTSYDVSHVLST